MTDNSQQGNLSNAIGRGLIKLIRFYTFNSPLKRGKLRLSRFGMRFSKALPGDVLVETNDGRRLYADLSTGMCESLYFQGEYEHAVSSVIKRVVRPGDVCMDVGANLGWYTTLLHQLSGSEGEVHAFEPVPKVFAALSKNVALLEDSSNVHINNFALGDAPGKVELHIFAGIPNGHTSISTQGFTDYTTIESSIVTLDSYMEEKNVGRVDFVKVDIEGAELMFFKGAGKLFHQEIPPIWMIEMALGTTKGFGYLPQDLIDYMKKHVDYNFYAVQEPSGKLKQVAGFPPEDIGANVLCVPAARYHERFNRSLVEPLLVKGN
ncbi:MAG TPA: FkbM family methyltransferase [Pyrinomonadaceae bacterium]|jgi:FkbM family methyltransferase